MVELKTVPCKICEEPTSYTGTGLCDYCWHLEKGMDHIVTKMGKAYALAILFSGTLKIDLEYMDLGLILDPHVDSPIDEAVKLATDFVNALGTSPKVYLRFNGTLIEIEVGANPKYIVDRYLTRKK